MEKTSTVVGGGGLEKYKVMSVEHDFGVMYSNSEKSEIFIFFFYKVVS